ncbi:MAG: glycosyltransferase involved in cell wall biosynthesis [Glaciecola sp.]|jgi:glycosyltransferase involved in cell wall biosynthesis
MTRVCVVTSTYSRHSSDFAVPWMRESIKRLIDAGDDVTIFAPSFKGLVSHSIDGVRVVRFRYFLAKWEVLTHNEGAPAKISNPLLQLLAIPYTLFGMLAMRSLIHKQDFDVIHVHWPFPHAFFAWAIKRMSSAAVVGNCHGAELAIGRRKAWVRRVLRWNLNQADQLIANSNHTAEEIYKVCGRKAHVIPFGTTVDLQPLVERNNPIPVILFTGRHIQRKGIEYLIQAIPILLRNRSVQLVITGDGDQRAMLEELTSKLCLEDSVEFKGFVSPDELSALYSSCDVYVLPSVFDDRGDAEGLGVTSIEAFLNECPVVATDVGGIVDVVHHEKTGLLVPEKNPEAIAAAVTRFLEDQDFAKQMGRAGREFAQEHFDWDRITDQIQDVYRLARGLPLPTRAADLNVQTRTARNEKNGL